MTQAVSEIETQASHDAARGSPFANDERHRAERAASEKRRSFARLAKQRPASLFGITTCDDASCLNTSTGCYPPMHARRMHSRGTIAGIPNQP